MTITAHLDALPGGEAGTAFDRFVAGSRFAAYQQSRAWADAAPAGRHDWRCFTAREGSRIVGAALVRRTPLVSGQALATLPRGPIVQEPDRLPEVLASLATVLADDGCCSVRLAPRVRGRDLPAMAEAMRAAGYAALPDGDQPLHRATGIVWLDRDEDAILAGFRQRARRQLRAAEAAGVRVRAVDGADDLAAFQRQLDRFRAARPDYDMSGLPDAEGQARLVAALGGGLLLAERDGAVVGAHAWVRQADEAIWLALATEDGTRVSAATPLLWAAMRAARAGGAVGYDLAGVPVDSPRNPGEAGRAQFKAGFAPTRRIMPAMHVLALRPVAHFVLYRARRWWRASRRAVAARATG